MTLNYRLSALGLVTIFSGTPFSASASPLDRDTVVTEPTYESALQGYVRDTDAEVGGWKAANDRVGRIGGWRTYLERARDPVKSESNTEEAPVNEHSNHNGG